MPWPLLGLQSQKPNRVAMLSPAVSACPRQAVGLAPDACLGMTPNRGDGSRCPLFLCEVRRQCQHSVSKLLRLSAIPRMWAPEH
jgi:hypothetical protein